MENKNKKYSSLISIILIVFCVILIFWLSNTGSSGKSVGREALTPMLEQGEISEVYVSGGTLSIKLVDEKTTTGDKPFPKYADCYIEYSSSEQAADIVNIFEEYNLKVYKANYGTDEEKLEFAAYANREIVKITTPAPKESFLSTITPYISIIIMIVIIVFMWRLFSGKSAPGNTFGKSRAKLSEKSNVRFNDIAGADEEKQETQEIVEFLKNPAKFKALGARIPKGVLLVGPPGTGKTLLAKAIAGESNVPFFSMSGSDFVELYVGVGASRVRDLFETAKKSAPCIVFIDEIDAVGRQRGTGLGGGNDEREQTLNQLLVEMDGFESNSGIIVLAATNRSDVLDPALMRPGRFDRQIYVNVPDVRGREGIIKIHARNKPIDADVDFKQIARLTTGFTGADIENFLNEAAILAAREGKTSISMEDITEGINKVLMGPKKKSAYQTEKTKKLTAYHESGHTILAKKLQENKRVSEVSIIPRGMAGGYTSVTDKDDDSYHTYSELKAQICMTMGGRIAEQIIFGDITPGASSDISQASKLARKMITEWGMSKKLGFVNYGSDNEVFIGRDYSKQSIYSDKTASEIDDEVLQLMNECYDKAYSILKDNENLLHNMAKLLLEKETIYEDEVDAKKKKKTSEEVVELVNKKEKLRKRREARKKREIEKAKAEKLKELKLSAANALKNAGVFTEEEYNSIVEKETAQTKKEIEKIESAEKQEEEEDLLEEKKEVVKTETNGKDKKATKKVKENKETKTVKTTKPKTKKEKVEKVKKEENKENDSNKSNKE